MNAVRVFGALGAIAVLSGCSSGTPVNDEARSSGSAVEVAMTRGETMTTGLPCSSLGDAFSPEGEYVYCMQKTTEALHFTVDGKSDTAITLGLMTNCTLTMSWRSNTQGLAWRTLHPVDCFTPPDELGPADVAFEGAPPDSVVTGVRDLVSVLVLGAPTTTTDSSTGPLTEAETLPGSFSGPNLTPAADIDIRKAFNILPKECSDYLLQFLDKLGADMILRARLEQAKKAVPQDKALIAKLEKDLARVHRQAEECMCKLLKCITGNSETLQAILEWLADLVGFPMPKCDDGKVVGAGPAPAPVQLPANGGIKIVPKKDN